MLGEVLHLYGVEASKAAMDGDEGEVDATNLHHLHQLLAEVQTRCGGRHGTLVLGIDGLELLHVILRSGTLLYDVAGQRC